MKIAVISEVSLIQFDYLQKVCLAIQKQLDQHFVKSWAKTAQITAFKSLAEIPAEYNVITVKSNISVKLDGFHGVDDSGKPYGEIKYWQRWTYTLSHEVLEMVHNPYLKEFRKNPSIIDPNTENPLFVEEVADATDGKGYFIDGIEVSNFITPYWYDIVKTDGRKYDYLGLLTAPRQLYEGGYVSWLSVTNEYYQAQKTKGILYVKNLTKNTPFEAIASSASETENTKYFIGGFLFLVTLFIILKRKN